MITTKYVRDHIEDIRMSIMKRKSSFPLEELLSLDEKWRTEKTELQELQSKRNTESLKISEMKKKNKDPSKQIKMLAEIKAQIEERDEALKKKEERINELIWSVPNIIDKSVPVGQPPEGNKIIRTWGKAVDKEVSHLDVLVKLGYLV